MTNLEFSNEFDVLYNNITSNQAPGLNEYEKSVFLTKAQDEIVKGYFNPRTNKTQEGFDASERRQIDFSMITKSISFNNTVYIITNEDIALYPGESIALKSEIKEDFLPTGKEFIEITKSEKNTIPSNGSAVEMPMEDDGSAEKPLDRIIKYSPFNDPLFDNRENSKSVNLNSDILMIINEYIIVKRGNQKVRLTVANINYDEYDRLMSKPYKRPLKFNAWRLLDNFNNQNNADLIVGPNDEILGYSVRYIRRPRPIILDKFDNVTIDGLGMSEDDLNRENPCELDPILHKEILQRAVELAKASYSGDLTSQLALGQNSQTNIGMLTQSK